MDFVLQLFELPCDHVELEDVQLLLHKTQRIVRTSTRKSALEYYSASSEVSQVTTLEHQGLLVIMWTLTVMVLESGPYVVLKAHLLFSSYRLRQLAL
eukprot:1195966-Prorocentrum_minimum.AAC.6